MPNDYIFQDHYRMTKPTKEQLRSFEDNYTPSDPDSNVLEVTFEATHSALYNPWKRFYLPSRMQQGTDSFVKGRKPKKILKHHNSEEDPVGIIIGAEYVPTIPDSLKNNKDVSLMTSTGVSISRQVQAADRFIQSGIPFEDGWEGLGFVKLRGLIKDEKTINQIYNELFDSVSTTFNSPDAVFCSTCTQNIAKDGWCEHEPGETYKDSETGISSMCTLIPAIFDYKELSLVVFDADPLTSITIESKDSAKPYSISVSDWKKDSNTKETNSSFEFRDSVTYKEEHMAFDITTLSDTERTIFDLIKGFRPEGKDEDLADFAKSIAGELNEDGILPNQVEAELEKEKAVEYLLEAFETKDQKIDGDAICDEMQKELQLMKDEGILSEEDFVAADAKLSTEARKKLSKSTFCGPERSFPVPDCAHVTAAKRLIGRYKGPGNKASILACVNRKAKALGCNSSSDSEPDQGNVNILPCNEDSLKKMEDDKLRNLFHSTELELIGRNLKMQRECSDCAKHIEEARVAKEELGKLRDKISDMENTFSVLRDELKRSYADYSDQVDKTVNLNVEKDLLKAEKVALVGVLTQKYDNLEDAMKELKDSKDIKQEESKIMDSFDLEAATLKLNDGMSREPSGQVDDPDKSGKKDNTQFDDELSESARVGIENIKDFIKQGQVDQAKRLYVKMKSFKLFNDDRTFQSFFADDDSAK